MIPAISAGSGGQRAVQWLGQLWLAGAFPGGSEGASGAMIALAPDDLDTVLAITVCGEDCAE